MKRILATILLIYISIPTLSAQELYTMPSGQQTRWISFENSSGSIGAGGMENKGAKGHAFDHIPAGSKIDLVNLEGCGTIRRIWMTLSDRSPEMLRSLRIDMYWDGNEKPAVSVPLGDFFGVGLGQKVAFESALFSDPEGRSFNCIIPMPFLKGARITVSNESDKDLYAIFYDVDITLEDHPDPILYFHACWNRDTATSLGQDFLILPPITGKGRFLGCNIGVISDKGYGKTWFGEGEVKIYLDDDSKWPTLVGSGTEDYIGTAYGQGTFSHLYQGCLLADPESGRYAFYRYHIPDPVWFRTGIRVSIQQIGGAPRDEVIAMLRNGTPLIPVSIDNSGLIRLLDLEQPVDLARQPDGWTNFYRSDDVSATAYFYLDSPVNKLAPLQYRDMRCNGL